MTRLHISDLHLAERMATVFAQAAAVAMHPLHRTEFHDPPPRAVPAAHDWDDWHYYEGEK